MSAVVKHSILISGHSTSISLEPEFWEELKQIALNKGLSLSSLVAEIDNNRTDNLCSALRVFVLNEIKNYNRD